MSCSDTPKHSACLGFIAFLLVSFSVATAAIDPVNPPPPPLVTTSAWFDWYQSLLSARINAVTFTRDQTRYISSSMGADANDGLTPSTPWRTVTRARDWIISTNPTGETRETLFRRGDVWRTIEGITTSAIGVRFADYGGPNNPRPYFTGFTDVVQPNDPLWTQGAAAGVYFRDEPTAVSWTREDQDVDLDSPLSQQSTLNQVASTPGSWWWDASVSRLYIHPRGGDSPLTNGKLYEIAHTTGRGFSPSGDLSLVENIRADGFGLDPAITSPQNEAFQSRVAGVDQAVFRNCVSYYGSSHIITHNTGVSPLGGGVATFIDCTAGFTKINFSGESVFNTFASAGGNQTIFHNCTVARGTLPSFDHVGRRADPVFGHTSQPNATIGLTIVYGLRILNHPLGALRTGRFNNAPLAPTLSDVRVFLVNTLHEGGNGTGDQLSPMFYAGAAYVNCQYTLKPADLGALGRFQATMVDGWWINSTLDLDLSNQTAMSFGLYQTGSSDNRARIWNSEIILRNVPDGLEVRIDRNGATNSPQSSIFNSIVAKLSQTGAISMTLPNSPANILANAYWNTPIPTADSAAVQLPAAPVVGAPPAPGSPLVGGGVPLPVGTLLDFDQTEKARVYQPPTIGPLEADLIADLNADGIVDGADLAILLTNWGNAPAAGDLNSDGVVNGSDLAILLINWSV